jgi:hypothetical protein
MDRRRAPRRVPLADEPISRARLRTGREMLVLDVSTLGLLVETDLRLLPGTHVDVHIVTRGGRVLVRSRVARCHVAAVRADVVTYHGALMFERAVDTSGYPVPVAAARELAAAGAAYPAAMDAAAVREQQRLTA